MAVEIIDFEALWDLIESRFTNHLYKRHIVAINRICDKRVHGIFLDELPQFTKLLKLCKNHIENNRLEFLVSIINLLSVTLKPFITEKSFEKIECFDVICDYFKLISSLLEFKYIYITTFICRGIKNYIIDILDYKVINESGIIQELVDSLRSYCYGAKWKIEEIYHKESKTMNNEYLLKLELSLELIGAIKILSYSDQCVLTLVENASILDLKIIYDSEMNDLFLTNSVELLWNIIESAPFHLIEKYLQIDYFNIFISLLRKYMKQIDIKNKINHKQLRNCIFSIIFILSKHESMHKYFQRSQIIKIILKYIDFVLNDVHLQTNQDFQLLCIIYNIIHRICKCYRVLSILVDKKFIINTTDQFFIVFAEKNKQWTPTQIANIRLQIIYIFQTMIQILPKTFFKNKIINDLFQFFVGHQQSISHHHSINKKVDIISKSLLRLFSKSLYNLKKKQLSDSIFINSLQEILNMQQIKDILLQIMNHASFEQITRTDCVLILSFFTKLDVVNNNKFRNEYHEEIIQSICNLLHSLPSLQYYQQFQNSLIKCLRNMLNESPENQIIFFNQHGIEMLINIIQKSPSLIIENALNLLLELSSNEQFKSEIKSLEQQYEYNVIMILLDIWEKSGLFSSIYIFYYFMIIYKSYTEQNDDKGDDETINLRVMRSVYCLYCKIRTMIHLKNIDPVTQHKITKILNYSQMREGREWFNLQKEFKKEEIELTRADSVELESKINKYKTIKSQLNSAESSLKIIAVKQMEENMNDLMNKLNLYKTQQAGINIRESNKEALLGSTIKLNKDQKDEIVAKSLQLNETMKKVFGDQ